MTEQPYQNGGPYEGYDYDPYGQPQPQPGAWPTHEQRHAGSYEGYEDQGGYDSQTTQQWQGQTWETQTHAPVPAYEEHQEHQQYQQYQQPVSHGYAQQYAAPEAVPAPPAPPAPSASPASSEAEPEYGPATLAGNSRVTDAQRARLEGRSPIIEPGMRPALLTALLGLLLAVTAPVASFALLVPLVLLQAVTAAGWFRLNGMWPARQGIALAFAGGLAADAAVLVAGRDDAPAAILGPLGLWVLLSLVLQLRSHASPDERMYGLMATVVSASLTVLATAYLGAGTHAVTVGAAAVAVAVLARALPLPTPASVVVALLAAAGAGIAVGGMTDLGTKGAFLGAAAGACALIGHRVASYDYPSRFVHFTAGVALPLSAAAPVVWVLGRALS
ncbi:hypothetical protein NX794_04990 [Streptomyces sp. LP11]|uniref:Integral membrane protein n=1 Tax=Streptomyces pyxinicus TaxID=2970331 RepID=A0ABT2AWH3_9ACTN|nr:hypothetical protein [Streptomyces sp. LP11]MCS0600589.1 hypothetical protein [Streptomyces sp. LP11]